jgi:hypothetical protein
MLLQGQAQRRGSSQELQLHPPVVLANTRLSKSAFTRSIADILGA